MAGRGGLTPGAGRKFGAKDKIPRARTGFPHPATPEEELVLERRRIKWASAEIGRLVAENDKLREQLNYGTQFHGDSKALMEATMAGTYFPSAQQLYSARELFAHQYPRPEPTRPESEFGIFDRPEYLATIAAITKALVPYPEARRAVAEALRRLENGRGSPPLVIDARPVEA